MSNKIFAFIVAFFCCCMSFVKLAQAEINIGLIAPLTGPAATYGIQIQNGVKFAVEDINKKGGVLGQKIQVIFLDDAAEPKQTVSAVNELASQNVHFLIGPATGNSALSVLQLLEENGILSITPSSTATQLTEQGVWNFFRATGRDDQQAIFAADYVAKNMKDKKIAILHDKGTYGFGLAQAFQTALHGKGLKEVFFGSINTGEKDYSAVISRLKNLNVDLIYYGGYYTEAGLLLRQLRNANSKAVLLGADGLSAPTLWSIAREAANGTLFTNIADLSGHPEAIALAQRMAALKVPSDGFTIQAYVALQILAEAIEKSGSTNPEAVAEFLHSGRNFDTVIGPISFDEKGDIKSDIFKINQWTDGKIVPLAQ